MPDKPLDKIFGVPGVESTTHLLALSADMSAMRTSLVATEKALDKIEIRLAVIQSIQGDVREVTGRLSALETRSETIDRNVDALQTHEQRISRLERDIIPDGSRRIGELEGARKTRKRDRYEVAKVIVLGVAAFVATHFIWPLAAHMWPVVSAYFGSGWQ